MPTPFTDQEKRLIQLLQSGDNNGVRLWYQEYSPKITRCIAQRIACSQDVEELVQQTFMDCLQQLPLFLGQSSLLTWMCSIAKHQVADYYRKKYAKRAIKHVPLLQSLCMTPLSDAHETSEKVQRVLHQMSASSKELLLQKYVDQKTVLEMAKDLGKTIKAIESELFRARQQFRLLFIAEDGVIEGEENKIMKIKGER